MTIEYILPLTTPTSRSVSLALENIVGLRVFIFISMVAPEVESLMTEMPSGVS